MSDDRFIDVIAEFYRAQLRHIAWIRIPKEAIWAGAVFFKWQIWHRLKIAIWTAKEFLKWQVLRPAIRAVIPRNLMLLLHAVNGRANSVGKLGLLKFLVAPAPRSSLVALSKVLPPTASDCRTLFPAGLVFCSRPDIFPLHLAELVPPLVSQYVFPEVTVTTLANAEVTSLSNLVIVQQAVVHHDLYTFSHDSTSEELHGRIRIYPKQAKIARYALPDTLEYFEVAACFTDSCAPNYAHWLTEVLPRIHAFSKDSASENCPLVIDAGLHVNLRRSAELLSRADAVWVELKAGSAASVDRLSFVSPGGYLPFERRTGSKTGHSHGRFSPAALQAMRDHLSLRLVKPSLSFPTKVLLRRSTTARALTNEQELEDRLTGLGFVAVYPEKLSFQDQFHLFSNAEVIVGATGAAFANIIFCPPTTHVVICLSAHLAHSFGYWVNMAAAVGNKVTYVLGPIEGSKAHGVHASFRVNIDDVFNALKISLSDTKDDI